MRGHPNILILCPDEMKASLLGCYGGAANPTPCLDRLARESVLFEQTHTVHPKCVPSRAAFLTGQYPHVNGHRTLALEVRPHEINLVQQLKGAGYETALLGKNHVVDAETLPFTFDFHRKAGGMGGMQMEASPPVRMPAESYYVGEAQIPLKSFGDYLETESAMEWLSSQRDKTRPFFLWLNWNAPHPPYSIPKPYYGCIDRSRIQLPPVDDPSGKPPFQRVLQRFHRSSEMSEADWRELIGCYLDMYRFIDDEVARILVHLERIGERENTLILLWSDHGDFAGEHQLPEKWDTAFYDCITRVPALLHWRNKLAPRRVPALIETIDLLPTILAQVGVPLPKGIQGQDLTPLLKGQVSAMRDIVFCQGGQERELLTRVVPPHARERPCRAYQAKQAALYAEPFINVRSKMIRETRFKYTYRLGGYEELYDLQEDPWEVRNLAGKAAYEGELKRLRQRLLEKLIEAETVEPWQGYLES